jgi:hypothetical protein
MYNKLEYAISKSNEDTYNKIPLDETQQNFTYIKDLLETEDMLYASGVWKYNNLYSNYGMKLKRIGHVACIDSILVNSNEIDKLYCMIIEIGGSVIWNINIPFLISLGKLEECGDKVKICIPKGCFFGNYDDVEYTSVLTDTTFLNVLKCKDIVGIPLIALQYHEIRIYLYTTSNIKYDLIVKFTYLNSSLAIIFTNKFCKFNINHIEEIHNDLITNIDIINIPNNVANDALNSGKLINYINTFNKNARKYEICKSNLLYNVLNDIIEQYDYKKNDEIVLINFNGKKYIIILLYFHTMTGIGGKSMNDELLKELIKNYIDTNNIL